MEKQVLPPFNQRRYQAAKNCPCGKSNRDGKFTPYKGHEDKGYCHSCGETFLPELKKDDSFQRFQFPNTKRKETGNDKKIDFLPYEMIRQTLKCYDQNNFVKYLVTLFREEIAFQLVDDFLIGTAKNNRTVFHQVDYNVNLRQSKVILYDPCTGRRSKEIPPYQVGRKILGEGANIQPCFFNEIDLRLFPDKPIAICESEKSAILSSVFLPEFNWIATGGIHGIKWNQATCKVLENKTVILFPDIQAYDNWKTKAEEIKKLVNCKISVSDLLEKLATPEQRKQKLDIADFLIKQDETRLAVTDNNYPVIWDNKK
jgi:hypothetical protein